MQCVFSTRASVVNLLHKGQSKNGIQWSLSYANSFGVAVDEKQVERVVFDPGVGLNVTPLAALTSHLTCQLPVH